MRVLITGAGGFVGARVFARLAASPGCEVRGVWGPGSGHEDACDLADVAATRSLMTARQPDVVLHLAAMSSVAVGAGRPDEVWRNNFDATRAVALAARALDRPVHLVFASSAEVYGRMFNAGPCDEETAVAPTSTYGRTKAASEFELQDLARDGLSVTALRLFNHTGPGQDERFVLPSFAAQIAEAACTGLREVRVGNLEARRDFTDVRDVVEAYAAVALTPPAESSAFRVFNVGAGRSVRIGDLLQGLMAISGLDLAVVQDPGRMRPSDIPLAEGRFDRIRKQYGWCATTDFGETLAALYASALAEAQRRHGTVST